MDLALNTNQIVIAVALMVYIIVTSIAINRYHKYLTGIKQSRLRYKHKYIDETTLEETLVLTQQAIKDSKRRFYLITVIAGICHLIACLFIGSNLLSAGIPFLLFILLLAGNYWLRGSSVSSSLKNVQGTSEYRGL